MTHPIPSLGTSQCDAVLAGLEAARGEWVEMPKLAKLAGDYAVHSRVSDLRTKRGLHIEHKNVFRKLKDGRRKVLSYYRLS